MASRDITLCNQALIKIGTKTIENYTDNAVGILCDQLFETSLYAYSTMYKWTWNEKVVELDAVSDPDPEPIYYENEFTLPNDFLHLRQIKDSATLMVIDQYDLRMKKVYCNYDSIIIRYACRVEADDLPYVCDDSFSSYLAHRLAPALEDSNKAADMWQEFLQKANSAFMEDAEQRQSPIDPDSYQDLGR